MVSRISYFSVFLHGETMESLGDIGTLSMFCLIH